MRQKAAPGTENRLVVDLNPPLCAPCSQRVLEAGTLHRALCPAPRHRAPSRDYDRRRHTDDVEAGRYALALTSDSAIGTVRLTLEDGLVWPDAPTGEALYIHRLAVRRSHSGGLVSAALPRWAAERTVALGRRYLRLDCEANRLRLRAVYERFGCAYHSERTVRTCLVARYQHALES